VDIAMLSLFIFSFLQQDLCHEVVFEKLQFASLHRSMAPTYGAIGFAIEDPHNASQLPCALIVDAGHSFSHVVPVYNSKPITAAVQRVNVGGKMITNLLKQSLSVRQIDLQSETHLVTDIKQKLCFVSTNYADDLRIASLRAPGENTLRRDFILPDFLSTFQGHVRDPAESIMAIPPPADAPCVVLTNERFAPPEALFRPADVGMDQTGLPGAIMAALAKCPPELRGPLLSNIVCVGGCFMMPQAAQRLQQEVRALAPDAFPVKVHVSSTPMLSNWHGAAAMARHVGEHYLYQLGVTKAEWDEAGSSVVKRKFNV
jgi:actin-related protein 6